MKATLEFNLPDDESDFQLATKASKWYCLAWDLDQILRAGLKYGSYNCEDSRDAAFEYIRKELHDIMEASGIQFD